jgi:hypothetical protein
MALARIITHSDLCARELAFHLLGRGYAVEIVSPDSIPNNFADLELRVDGQSGDQLVASLEAHEGQRTGSLGFVHRVKAPTLPDLESSTNLQNGERANTSPLQNPLPSPTSAPAESESVSSEVTRAEAMSAAVSARETPDEPLSYFARQTSSIASPFAGPAVALPTWQPQLIDRPVEKRSVVPAALALSVVVLLALFLAVGVRQTAKASRGSFTSAPTALPARTNSANAISERVATVDNTFANRPVAGRAKVSTMQTADRIAPDTVIYLDSRYKPASKPLPNQRGEVDPRFAQTLR